MTDQQPDPGPGGPVGSVGEEAAKLLDALQGWARDSGAFGPSGPGQGTPGAAGTSGTAGPAGAAGAAGTAGAAGVADHLRSVDEHIATGGRDCVYCPLCQLISRVRGAGPEVRSQLAVGASSFLHAAATLLEARAGTASSGSRAAGEPHVTKIDLDDEAPPLGRDD